MGTIIRRLRKDGTMGHTAQIRIKKDGKVIHTESQTFDRDGPARVWMAQREAELAKPGGMATKEDPMLSVVIDTYLTDKLKPHGKTKDQVLRTIKQSWIGEKRCSEIKSATIIEYLKGLESQPQTRGNYLSHLSAVIAVARPAWGYPLDKEAAEDARVVADKLGLISRSKSRTRRPTLDELNRLMGYYETMERKRPDALPMQRLILFSIFSTRRQEETCRIAAEDINAANSQVIVRDMKNPGEKVGNDVTTTLTPEALRLIVQQGVKTGRIWPHNAESVSTSFTRACKILAIEDLHFHDLRHDGVSRLFELGWTIPQVATVSGHRSWKGLQRYTHITQVGDKYDGWHWKEKLLA